VALGRRATRAVRHGRRGRRRRRGVMMAFLYRRRGHRLVHGDPPSLLVQRATVKVALERRGLGGRRPVMDGRAGGAGRARLLLVAAVVRLLRRRRRVTVHALGRVRVYDRRVHRAATLFRQFAASLIC